MPIIMKPVSLKVLNLFLWLRQKERMRNNSSLSVDFSRDTNPTEGIYHLYNNNNNLHCKIFFKKHKVSSSTIKTFFTSKKKAAWAKWLFGKS